MIERFKHFEEISNFLNLIKSNRVLFLLGGIQYTYSNDSNAEWCYLMQNFGAEANQSWHFAMGKSIKTTFKDYDIIILSPHYKHKKELEFPSDYYEM